MILGIDLEFFSNIIHCKNVVYSEKNIIKYAYHYLKLPYNYLYTTKIFKILLFSEKYFNL